MRISLRGIRSYALIITAAALAACSDSPLPTSSPARAENRAIAPGALAASVSAAGSSLLACPSTTARTASGVIDHKGGIVQVDGNALIVPPKAVKKKTRFTVTVPASQYVEIDVSAEGYEHYTFKRPVAISVSYARCADSALPPSSLDAWWIDPATRSALGVMVGVDNRSEKRLTFITDHLSGYAVVYRTNENEDGEVR